MWLDKTSGESENKIWMTANTKPCPKCQSPVEKSSGCNHVTCRCGQVRPAGRPPVTAISAQAEPLFKGLDRRTHCVSCMHADGAPADTCRPAALTPMTLSHCSTSAGCVARRQECRTPGRPFRSTPAAASRTSRTCALPTPPGARPASWPVAELAPDALQHKASAPVVQLQRALNVAICQYVGRIVISRQRLPRRELKRYHHYLERWEAHVASQRLEAEQVVFVCLWLVVLL